MTPTLAQYLDQKANNLAAVRIVAATAVLWAHAWVVSAGSRTEELLHVFAFTLDWHGVHAFFILSGMLLTRSYMRHPDAVRFVVARLIRYVPGILVSTAVAAFVIGPLVTTAPLADYFGSGAPFRFVALVTSLTDVNAMLPGVLDQGAEPNTLYIPLWTIRYELVFAFCLAGAGLLGLIGRRRLTLAALALTLGVNVVWFWNGEGYPALGSPHHLVRFTSTFGIGVGLAVFADRIPVSRKWFAAAIAAAAVLAFSPVAALAGMLLLAYAIVAIGFTRLPLAAPLARLGAWSYGFYVSGFLIEQCVTYLAPSWNGWMVFAVSTAVALAAGGASWRLIEKPSLRWVGPLSDAINRRLPRGGTAPDVAGATPKR